MSDGVMPCTDTSLGPYKLQWVHAGGDACPAKPVKHVIVFDWEQKVWSIHCTLQFDGFAAPPPNLLELCLV